MKSFSASLVMSLLALTAPAALPQPDLIAKIHFAGADKIFADPNATAFTNEFSSPEALALREQTASKLAVWLSGWLQTKQNVSVPDGAVRLHPLFEDIQTAEFFFAAQATANRKPEVAIAIKLNPARAQLWRTALRSFFPAASLKSSGAWLVFDSTPDQSGLGDHLAQELSKPPAAWLDLDVNWPRLAQWYPELLELGLPETQFKITAPDDNFRVNGKFLFPQNLALNLEPWGVPTNIINTPFDSFTAVRGFASWYQSQAWAQPYQLSPTPNQLFVWSLPGLPFLTYAAMPVPDPSAALDQAMARLVPQFSDANNRDAFLSAITPTMGTNEISFAGTPFVSPRLRALKTPSGKFLLAELFPNISRGKPLPPELFQRLATPNLVYYHWEITASRIPELLHVTQLGLMLTWHKQLQAESAAYKWMQRAGGRLGNTDTEITQSGPAELTFARKTPGIFTAPEMFVLANWLEATNFPGYDIKMPPHSQRWKQSRHQMQLSPVPAPPATH